MADKITFCVNKSDLDLVMSLARRVLTEHLEGNTDMDDKPEGLDYTLFDYRASLGAIDRAMAASEKTG